MSLLSRALFKADDGFGVRGRDFLNPRTWFTWGRPTRAGVRVNEESALALSAYYACIRCISEDIAKLPLITYRRLEDGKERASDDSRYKLLHDRPNEDMTSVVFRQLMQSWALGWGNAYARIERDNGIKASALYPIHPAKVKVVRGDSSLQRRSYEVTYSASQKVQISAENMLHIHGIGDENGGWSIAAIGAESLGLAMAAQQYGASFFGNNSTPSGVISMKESLDPEKIKELRQQWADMHSGPDNAHKPAILEDGTTFTPIGIPPDQAQFLECVVPETMISMADGSRKAARDIMVGDLVLGWDQGVTVARISAVGKPPIKKLVKITSNRGRSLTASFDHPCLAKRTFRTPGGSCDKTDPTWISMGDLKVGESIRVGLGNKAADDRSSFDDSWFLGAMVGDGSIRRGSCEFTSKDSGVIARMKDHLQTLGGNLNHKERYSYTIQTGGVGRRGSVIRDTLNESGLVGTFCETKRVPKSVLSGGPTSWRGFLSGYLDTDGSIAPSRGKNRQPLVYWSSVNRPLLEECQHMLSGLGVNSAIYLTQESGERMVCGKFCKTMDCYGLYVTGSESLRDLSGLLDLAHSSKRERLSEFSDNKATRYRIDNWLYDKIVSVEDLGDGETIGIEVEDCNTHITGGFVTHNSRQFTIEDIGRWFRMPPHKIQHLLRATFSNISHQSIEYVQDTLTPWFVRWEQEIQVKLFPFDDDLFAEYLSVAMLRGDEVARGDYYNKLFAVGGITVNQICEAENFNGAGIDGDVRFIPMNMQRLEDAANPPDPLPPPPPPGTGNPVDGPPPPIDQGGDQAPTPPSGPNPSGDKTPKNEAPEPISPPISLPPPAPIAPAPRPSRAVAAEALRPVIEAAALMILRKEEKAAARMAEKFSENSAGFGTWLDSFYADHALFVSEALRPAGQALAALVERAGWTSARIARGHVETSRRELRKLHADGKVITGFPGFAVERVKDLVNGVISEVTDGIL